MSDARTLRARLQRGWDTVAKAGLLTLALLAGAPASAIADSARFDIPAQPMVSALRAFAAQAHMQLLYRHESVANRLGHAVLGEFEKRDALQLLLLGTDLEAVYIGTDATTIRLIRERDERGGGQGVAMPGVDAAAQPRAAFADKAGTPGSSGLTLNAPAVGRRTLLSDATGLISSTSGLGEIVVTARKREESAIDVPTSITAFSEQSLGTFNIENFADYGSKISNLSFAIGAGAYGFADARSVAIRGISSSLYRAGTGFYIDDTPVPDNMDPRIVDIQRIEVLKGPQGTLYGSGSMGGNIKLVTNKPDLDQDSTRYRLQGSYTRDASGNYAVDAVSNFVLQPGTNAVRLMGFVQHDSGFVTTRWPVIGSGATAPTIPWDNGYYPELATRKAGGQDVVGASIADRTQVSENFEITFRLLYQRSSFDGWPTAYAPLPSFTVASLTENRAANVRESSTDRWSLPAIELTYRGRGWNLASSTSYFDRLSEDVEDGTEGTSQFNQSYIGLPLPAGASSIWYRNQQDRRFVHESRIAVDEVAGLSGVAGIYYSRRKSDILWPTSLYAGLASSGNYPSDNYFFIDEPTVDRETAVFGELYWRPIEKLTITAGARGFWNSHDATHVVEDGWLAGGFADQQIPKATESGVSPKAAVLYKLDEWSSVYASASKGFRSGGNAPQVPPACAADLAAYHLTIADTGHYDSDSLWSYEVGSKSSVLDHRLFVSAAAFQINWRNIQQFIALQCGLSFNGNSGAARVRGAELEVSGRPLDQLDLRLSAGYLDGKITDRGISPLPVGQRLFQTPQFTGSLGVAYHWPFYGTKGAFASADYSFVGSQLSGVLDPAQPIERPNYSLVNFKLGVNLEAGQLALFVSNLTNERANLGDTNTLAFRRYYNDLPVNRVAISRPQTIGLQFSRGF